MNEDQDVNANPEVAPEISAGLEETPAPVETSFASPAKKRPMKLIIAALLVAVAIVLIGGSVLGYTMWYQNPDKVVHDAVVNALKAKTGTAKGSITYTSDDFRLDIELDSKAGETGGDFTVTTNVTVTGDEAQQEFKATGMGRIIDDTLYVKVSGVRDVVEDMAMQSGGQIPEYANDVFEKIEDRWISIKASDYQEASEEIASQQTCMLDLFDKLRSDSAMTDEIADLYRASQVLIVQEELGSKKVNSADSFGYKITFDQDAAASFVTELENTTYGKELKNCDEDIHFKDIADDLTKEMTENEDEPVIELWVSKLGHEITEVAVYGQNNGTDELNINLQPTFNDDVTVEIPEGATSLKTVLDEIKEAITQYYSEMPPPQMTLPSDFDMGDVSPELQLAT